MDRTTGGFRVFVLARAAVVFFYVGAALIMATPWLMPLHPDKLIAFLLAFLLTVGLRMALEGLAVLVQSYHALDDIRRSLSRAPRARPSPSPPTAPFSPPPPEPELSRADKAAQYRAAALAALEQDRRKRAAEEALEEKFRTS
jgi:hypothetical protein